MLVGLEPIAIRSNPTSRASSPIHCSHTLRTPSIVTGKGQKRPEARVSLVGQLFLLQWIQVSSISLNFSLFY